MSSHGTYKKAKEAFVSQLQGSSITDINLVSLTALTTYVLWAALRNRGLLFVEENARSQRAQNVPLLLHALTSLTPDDVWTIWSIEMVILVLPIILACTVMSGHLVLLNGFLASLAGVLIWAFPSVAPMRLKKKDEKGVHWSRRGSSASEDEEDSSYRTNQLMQQQGDVFEHPFRVSVDSAAEAAHVAASPPTPFVPPGVDATVYRTEVQGKRENGVGLFEEVTEDPPEASTSARRAIRTESPGRLHKTTILRPLHGESQTGSKDMNALPSAYVPRNQPFLTVYRAHMMLMTIICILAVDFPAFPRKFAKCESWGTSLVSDG